MNHQQENQLAVLTAIAEMQNTVNATVNPDWINANYPFHRALWMEGGEAMNNYPWEWWKKSEGGDIRDLHLEVVDMFHFGVSMLLVEYDGDVESAAIEMQTDVAQASFVISNDAQTQMALLEEIVSAAAACMFVPGTFFRYCVSAGLSLERLFALYYAKNALNMFRQANGYKEGKYIKNWTCDDKVPRLEDNRVLLDLVQMLESTTPDMMLTLSSGAFTRFMTQHLELYYKAVKDYWEKRYPGTAKDFLGNVNIR